MRRVLFPFVGDTVGGSHVSGSLLIRALDEAGCRAIVGLHRPGGAFAAWLDAAGMPHEPLPDVPLPDDRHILAQAVLLARTAPALARLLRDRRIAIVHTNDARMHRLWAVPARLAGVPQVWHQRTPVRNGRMAGFARLSRQLVAVSAFAASGMTPGLRRRTAVIDDPFAVPDPQPDRRQDIVAAFPAGPSGPIVGFASNLAARKRPLLFVEAARRLTQDHGIDALFPLFGAPREPEAQAVRDAIAAAGLTDRCALMGSRYPLDPWLGAMDILIAPARGEGFGRILVEAMLAGTPVVASRDGGHPEIVTHGTTGLLVPPDDAAAIAAEALHLIAQPAVAARIAATARAGAMKRYGVSTHRDAILRIYDRLAPQSG